MSRAVIDEPTTDPGVQAERIIPATRTIPSVEIFQNQLPILIRQGQTKTITITGAVYDQKFTGNITLQPDPNFATGCPLFGNFPFNGVYNGVTFPVGPTSVSLSFQVTGPTNLPLGNHVCKLKYDAVIFDFAGLQTHVGKGNPVNIAYTLKKKKLPGEPDDGA